MHIGVPQYGFTTTRYEKLAYDYTFHAECHDTLILACYVYVDLDTPNALENKQEKEGEGLTFSIEPK